MKTLNPIITFLALCIILFSCSENETIDVDETTEPTEISEMTYDCEFVQNDDKMDGFIDDTERAIMTECMENELSSIQMIKDSLRGKWELIGHGEGWIPAISQPCGYIVFCDDELEFDFSNGFIDTIRTLTWDIELVNSAGRDFFTLTLSENVEGLFLNHFCEEYIYGDATPVDGNMYLYRKMN